MDIPDGSKKSILKNFIWNSGGNIFYQAGKWLLTILVVRLSDGYEDAGYLALAMSLSNVFLFIAAYSMRNYQVSDLKGEYSDNIYVTSRVVTTVISQLFFLSYCMFFIGMNRLSLVVILYMLLVSGESFADVLHGIAQKHWRLDLAGLSFVLRSIAVTAAFIILYQISGLILAVFGMAVFSLLIIIFFDARQIYKIAPFRLEFKWSDIRRLLKTCFPVVATYVLYALYATIARVSLESATDAATLGIYSSATIPAIVVTQAGGYIFTPLVNILSKRFSDGLYKSFRRFFILICGIVLLLAASGMLIAEIFGADVLSLLFGESIDPYAYLLTEAMVVAGLTLFLLLLIIVLTIMRKLYIMVSGCAAGFLACVLSAGWSLETHGVSGANIMQIIGLGVAVIILMGAYFFYIIKHKKGEYI
jgi:O-antigen/teichoic acid export membrane protein